MNLELEELRAFVAVAETLHFGEAAQRVGVSQPALTKRIQKLEAKLGGALFSRHTRGVSMTPAGVLLQERATNLLAEAAHIEAISRMAMRGEAGALRVGLGLGAVTAGVPNVLMQFRKRYPHVHVTVRDMASAEQLAALRREEIDVAFVRLPVAESAGLRITPVIEERLEVVTKSTERFRGKLRDVADQPFIILSRSTSGAYHEHVLATCRAAGFHPRVVQEANQIYTILVLVAAGLGVALAPSSARHMRLPGVRFSEAGVPEAAWRIGMVWREAARTSRDAVVANFASLARAHFRAAASGSVFQ